MRPPEADTIFAVATGAGRAAIAVVRLSGTESGALLDALCGRRPQQRRASVRPLRNALGELLDRALVLWMPGPASYSGEDAAELHLHAGPAVVEGVADALVQLGARPAEPGEFTRRAFLNGRMDLVEAEAVADLVASETSAQRRQALRQMDGALGAVLRGWAERLRRLLAEQEALIDFPDEDLPPEIEARSLAELTALHGELRAQLDDGRRGERLRDGLVFVVTGQPNVGKSSLFNVLSGLDLAIVSPSPGTTRDAIETRIVLDGVPVTLVDTAGVRETNHPVEAEGVRRALARADTADLVIAVSVAGEPALLPGRSGCPVLEVVNKADLARNAVETPAGAVPVSALTGLGIDVLRDRLTDSARRMTQAAGPPPLTRSRHRAALGEAAARLLAAASAPLPELRAEDLRLALRAMGRVTGQVGVEDLLDTVFAQFCIGK